jgi:hypothetical protein
MKDWLKVDWAGLLPRRSQPRTSLLALAFDGSRLEGVELRRTNGGVELRHRFDATLSLDLLTNDPELVGREIRKQLDAAGVRERRCVAALPLNWALTLVTPLPELPESDLASLLQIEAERWFPYGLDSLLVAQCRGRGPGDSRWAMQVAIPRDHVLRLEAALQAAQLRPVGLSLGIAALQPPEPDPAQGVVALVPGETSLGVQVTLGGGLLALRTIEGAYELEGTIRQLQAALVLRELRITLDQLAPELAEAIRRVRVFGPGETAAEIAEALGPHLPELGLSLERLTKYPPEVFGLRLPPGTPVSPAASLGLRYLAGPGPGLEFLPPRVSAWRQFVARHSSRKLVWAGGAAGAVAGIIALAFLIQQWQLTYWNSKWSGMKTQVAELEALQQQIKRFRPWFDESFRSLSILKRLTEAFPEDGAVTAKSVEIREAAVVTCTGTARDHQALLRTLDSLRAMKEIDAVQVEQMRGQVPMQFTFNFRWNPSATP